MREKETAAKDRGKLSWERRRFLAILGLPAFGVSLAYTVVTTYLPVLIEGYSGPAVTGLLIASEGLLALFLPILIGGWSDSLNTRIGGRMPFMLIGTALAVPALLLIPLSNSLVGIGAGLIGFFVAYFVYLSPYYALFPDLVPRSERGRSLGFQGSFRSIGLLVMLVSGGLLLSLWRPLPFLIAAVALVGLTAILFFGVRDQLGRREGGARKDQSLFAGSWELVRDYRDIRRWAIANAMWEAAIAALRAFIVLYLTLGLGLSLAGVSGALALVGVSAVVAAPLSGALADRYGHRPVMLAALWLFGLGLLLPLFTINTYFVAGILPIAFAAVTLITLPYSVLMGLLPEGRHHGASASLFGFSRGVGVLVGPLLAGLAVELSPANFLAFDETGGYAAVFGVSSAFLLASIPILRRMNIDGEGPAR